MSPAVPSHPQTPNDFQTNMNNPATSNLGTQPGVRTYPGHPMNTNPYNTHQQPQQHSVYPTGQYQPNSMAHPIVNSMPSTSTTPTASSTTSSSVPPINQRSSSTDDISKVINAVASGNNSSQPAHSSTNQQLNSVLTSKLLANNPSSANIVNQQQQRQHIMNPNM